MVSAGLHAVLTPGPITLLAECLETPAAPLSVLSLISPLASGPQYAQFVYQNQLSRNDEKHIHTEGYLTNRSLACEVFPVVSESKCIKVKNTESTEISTKNFSLKKFTLTLWLHSPSLLLQLPIPSPGGEASVRVCVWKL